MLHTIKSIGADMAGSRKVHITQSETPSDEHGSAQDEKVLHKKV